jgi:argininosuccinate lyase
MAKIVKKLGFDQEKIGEELEQGFAQATEIADSLAMKGMPFREAHEKTGKLVKECEKRGITLSGHKGIEKKLASLERKRLQTKLSLKQDAFFTDEEKKINEALSRVLR